MTCLVKNGAFVSLVYMNATLIDVETLLLELTNLKQLRTQAWDTAGENIIGATKIQNHFGPIKFLLSIAIEIVKMAITLEREINKSFEHIVKTHTIN